MSDKLEFVDALEFGQTEVCRTSYADAKLLT
jgi:hypothetical protein